MKISYIISSIRLKGYDYLQAGMFFVTNNYQQEG